MRTRPYHIDIDAEDRARIDLVALALEERDGHKWTRASVTLCVIARGLADLERELDLIPSARTSGNGTHARAD